MRKAQESYKNKINTRVLAKSNAESNKSKKSKKNGYDLAVIATKKD
ncbi:hypothetical protein [Helicobacter macacae]|nr:hypothetical protein [Helicobacter macacae]